MIVQELSNNRVEGKLHIVPSTIAAAKKFVAEHHRHHKPPQGGLFAVAIADDSGIRGVAVIGRPVARMLQDGFTAEVTRVGTDGVRNGCSMLYGAATRAAKALGYKKLITYTLPEEGGASLRAAGWVCAGEAGGGSWSVPSRPRVDKHPLQKKYRWEKNL